MSAGRVAVIFGGAGHMSAARAEQVAIKIRVNAAR
jgi:hypothetical protein